MNYIALFYSHFGAIRFSHSLPQGVTVARLMPVPRSLSSSCGTCVRFEGPENITISRDEYHEIEQVVKETEKGYVPILKLEAEG